ncbi:hypothetical protein P389DRAFT_165454, partial [Cystobasidium minutum MCA 4210]|uniref:uncharacterized protein n=1 Tax=Cystobasidium minutum MCA 4210 TaxID=1397322 RepID=UPI0034D01BF1|eukprot:jgi/Rhomi1/165454/fgenesh1_kg.1_\
MTDCKNTELMSVESVAALREYAERLGHRGERFSPLSQATANAALLVEEYARRRKLQDEQAKIRQLQDSEQLRCRYNSAREQFKLKLISMKSSSTEEACAVAIAVFPYVREQDTPFSELLQKEKLPGQELAELTKVGGAYQRSLSSLLPDHSSRN